MVTDAQIARIVNFLYTDNTHISIGTGAAPTYGSTTLAGEAQRQAASKLIDGNTIVYDAFWDESQANGVTYLNAGLSGNGATATLGTGQLMVGGGISVMKDSTQSLTVSVELTVDKI